MTHNHSAYLEFRSPQPIVNFEVQMLQCVVVTVVLVTCSRWTKEIKIKMKRTVSLGFLIPGIGGFVLGVSDVERFRKAYFISKEAFHIFTTV